MPAMINQCGQTTAPDIILEVKIEIGWQRHAELLTQITALPWPVGTILRLFRITDTTPENRLKSFRSRITSADPFSLALVGQAAWLGDGAPKEKLKGVTVHSIRNILTVELPASTRSCNLLSAQLEEMCQALTINSCPLDLKEANSLNTSILNAQHVSGFVLNKPISDSCGCLNEIYGIHEDTTANEEINQAQHCSVLVLTVGAKALQASWIHYISSRNLSNKDFKQITTATEALFKKNDVPVRRIKKNELELTIAANPAVRLFWASKQPPRLSMSAAAAIKPLKAMLKPQAADIRVPFLDRSGSIDGLDFFDPKKPTPTWVLTAGGGTGKTYFSHYLLMALQRGGSRVGIVDTFISFQGWQEFGFARLAFETVNPVSLNLFTMIVEPDLQLPVVSAALLAASGAPDTPMVMSAIEDAVLTAWGQKGAQATTETVYGALQQSECPSIITLLPLFAALCDETATPWLCREENFTHDCKSENIIFELEHLEHNPELFAMLTPITIAFNALHLFRTDRQKSVFFIDEAYQLLRQHPLMGELMHRIGTLASSCGGTFGLAYQSPQDFPHFTPKIHDFLTKATMKIAFQDRIYTQERPGDLFPEVGEEGGLILQTLCTRRPGYIEVAAITQAATRPLRLTVAPFFHDLACNFIAPEQKSLGFMVKNDMPLELIYRLILDWKRTFDSKELMNAGIYIDPSESVSALKILSGQEGHPDPSSTSPVSDQELVKWLDNGEGWFNQLNNVKEQAPLQLDQVRMTLFKIITYNSYKGQPYSFSLRRGLREVALADDAELSLELAQFRLSAFELLKKGVAPVDVIQTFADVITVNDVDALTRITRNPFFDAIANNGYTEIAWRLYCGDSPVKLGQGFLTIKEAHRWTLDLSTTQKPATGPAAFFSTYEDPYTWLALDLGIPQSTLNKLRQRSRAMLLWCAAKKHNSSMSKPRKMHLPGGLTRQYCFWDIIDEIREEDLVNGAATAPETAFDAANHRLQQLYEKELLKSTPLPPAPLEGTEEIIYLDTTFALWTEGKELCHCVGSYSHACKTGTSAIYSVRAGGQRSTVELAKHNGDWWMAQHRTTHNQEPTEQHKKLVKKWLKNAGKGIIPFQTI